MLIVMISYLFHRPTEMGFLHDFTQKNKPVIEAEKPVGKLKRDFARRCSGKEAIPKNG